MNRIDRTFVELKRAGKKGLVGYLTAGDPDARKSEENIRVAIEAGLDVLELGVPFSDPTADGPTIQAASCRALDAGMSLDGVFRMVSNLRKDYDIPIILFGYANPLFRYGYREACAEASRVGADGMLVVDLPFEEVGELRQYLDEFDLASVQLIAPTTTADRAARVLKDAKGFVYYVMVMGVTGTRARLAADVAEHVAMLRGCTDLPIAVGFGVSDGDQAKQAAESADAVVVGSALVRAAMAGTLRELVTELRRAI